MLKILLTEEVNKGTIYANYDKLTCICFYTQHRNVEKGLVKTSCELSDVLTHLVDETKILESVAFNLDVESCYNYSKFNCPIL